MIDMNDKVVIVSGATGGQGKAEVRLLVECGAQVVSAGATRRMVAQSRGRAIFQRHDVGSEAEWAAIVERAGLGRVRQGRGDERFSRHHCYSCTTLFGPRTWSRQPDVVGIVRDRRNRATGRVAPGVLQRRYRGIRRVHGTRQEPWPLRSYDRENGGIRPHLARHPSDAGAGGCGPSTSRRSNAVTGALGYLQPGLPSLGRTRGTRSCGCSSGWGVSSSSQTGRAGRARRFSGDRARTDRFMVAAGRLDPLTTGFREKPRCSRN
jgi:hypothetical protein